MSSHAVNRLIAKPCKPCREVFFDTKEIWLVVVVVVAVQALVVERHCLGRELAPLSLKDVVDDASLPTS